MVLLQYRAVTVFPRCAVLHFRESGGDRDGLGVGTTAVLQARLPRQRLAIVRKIVKYSLKLLKIFSMNRSGILVSNGDRQILLIVYH